MVKSGCAVIDTVPFHHSGRPGIRANALLDGANKDVAVGPIYRALRGSQQRVRQLGRGHDGINLERAIKGIGQASRRDRYRDVEDDDVIAWGSEVGRDRRDLVGVGRRRRAGRIGHDVGIVGVARHGHQVARPAAHPHVTGWGDGRRPGHRVLKSCWVVVRNLERPVKIDGN